MASEPTAALVLEDIAHPITPPPAPGHIVEQEEGRGGRSEGGRVVGEEEVAAMRRRVLEINPGAEDGVSEREKELVDMILKLTSPKSDPHPTSPRPTPSPSPGPSPAQLLLQAQTISSLLEQRNYLIREAEEQRARWESERDGWGRMAEALIAQRHRTGRGAGKEGGYVRDDSLHVVQDHERHYTGFETDNKALRTKLTDTQYRLSTLESQLTKLRPLLLMQPTISQTDYDRLHPHSQTHLNHSNLNTISSSNPTTKPISTEEPPPDIAMIIPSDEDVASSKPLPLPQVHFHPHHYKGVYSYPSALPAFPSTTTTTPAKKSHPKSKGKDRDKEREGETEREKDPTRTRKPTTLLADARAEHLLLAAQRLGRERAFVVGGLMQVEKDREGRGRRKGLDKDKDKDKEGTGKEKEKGPPKTPKRHGIKMGHKDSLNATPTGSGASIGVGVGVGDAAGVGGPGRGLFPVPTQGSFHLLNTPTQSAGYSTFPLSPTRTQRGRGKGKGKGVGAGLTGTPTGKGTRTNPPTPLDSLLSAARSLMEPPSPTPSHSHPHLGEDDEEEEDGYSGSAGAEGKRKMRKRVMPESPVPLKRRKMGGGNGVQAQTRVLRDRSGGGSGALGERVRSGLDVLADQAAAAATPSGKGKGKYKDKELEQTREEDKGEGPSTSRLLARPRTPLAENGTWSTLKPVQWGEEEASSSPVAEEREEEEEEMPMGGEDVGNKDGDGVTSSSTQKLTQVELERMIRNTLLEAEEQTRTQTRTEDADLPPSSPPESDSSPLRSQSQSLRQELPRAPTPDIFGSTVRPTEPIIPLPMSQSQNAHTPQGPPNFDFQPMAGQGPNLNPHRRSASIPPSFVPGPDDLEHQKNNNSRHNTAPELGMMGLTTMLDFDVDLELDLGDRMTGGFTGEGEDAEDAEMERAMNRDLARVGVGSSSPDGSAKRPRSPYIKWSREEDDLLAQAVSKYGQKWDLVQKALPSRGYHQVRQRWLRKLGVFDSKPDLSSFQTAGVNLPPGSNIVANGQSSGSPVSNTNSDSPLPQPKLGFAPLSSELAFSRRSS